MLGFLIPEKKHGKKAYGFVCHELEELSAAHTISWILKATEQASIPISHNSARSRDGKIPVSV